MLLSYARLRLTRALGRISGDAPEVHLGVEFDATYFAPKVGDYLEGTVSRIGSDHIALLVLGVFNASVAHPTGSRRGSLKQDDKAVFTVRNVTHANGLVSLHGELAEPGSYRFGRAPATAPSRAHAPPRASAPPAAAEGAASPAAAAAENGGAKPKRSKEEREEKKRRKAEKAVAASPPLPSAIAAAPLKRDRKEAAAGEETAEEQSRREHKHSKEEREAKKQRKAERAAAKAQAADS